MLDYPSRMDKFDMDIIIDEDEIKPDNCYVMLTNPITIIFNNDKKNTINHFNICAGVRLGNVIHFST